MDFGSSSMCCNSMIGLSLFLSKDWIIMDISVLPQLSPQMNYEDIAPVESTDINDPWSEVKSMLFDEESIALVDLLKRANVQVPDEVGFELTDDSGEVIAEIELAWIDKKVAFLTTEQESDSVMIEKMGWNVFRRAEKIIDFLKEDTK